MNRGTAIFVVAIGIGGLSCADRPVTPISPDSVTVQPTSPPAVTLTVSARCLGPFRPADYAPLACLVVAEDPTNAGRNNFQAFADLRLFGGSAASAIAPCPACGSPGKTFDLDLHVPAAMSPGSKTFAIWATDANGRRAETSAVLDIVAR